MLDKKIEFIITNKDHLDIWPSPKPAVMASKKGMHVFTVGSCRLLLLNLPSFL